MKIDFADVFASGVGWVLKQVFLFAVAMWFGCLLAGSSGVAARMALKNGPDFGDFLWVALACPLLLLTAWIVPNMIFMSVMAYRIIVNSDSSGFLSWGMLIAGESLFAMAGVNHFLPKEWVPITVAWVTWLHLVVMACTGLWILYHWNLNRFARQLVALKVENSARREELREKFGTENAGVDETEMF